MHVALNAVPPFRRTWIFNSSWTSLTTRLSTANPPACHAAPPVWRVAAACALNASVFTFSFCSATVATDKVARAAESASLLPSPVGAAAGCKRWHARQEVGLGSLRARTRRGSKQRQRKYTRTLLNILVAVALWWELSRSGGVCTCILGHLLARPSSIA